MIDFSKISQKSLIGKILRGILKIIPRNSVLPILQGRLKSKKWIIGSGVLSYWLGTYEIEKQRLFGKIVKNDDIVYDIGAHVWFYTLLASELVGGKGKVFSFEPNPRNIFYLRKHIALNNFKNIMVFEAAVSEKSGTALFNLQKDNFSGGRIGLREGGFNVKTVALDDLVVSEKLPLPNIIKIDIEGGEFAVLKGATGILEKYRPVIFLATHDEENHKNCLNFLELLGYKLKAIGGENIERAGEFLAYF
ncbi:MAG: FkbM family methyltransferase [Patescibacteria group bacterium]